tara:strand:+ start:2926 stop:4704 length:1779 start_codon:yes stop_codon:yes gene_type:complete
MTGVLLQLVAKGNDDMYFTGNPQVSYFKKQYFRHINLAIERLENYNLSTRHMNFESESQFNFNIDVQYGDILDSTFFHVRLPNITNHCALTYVDNLGEVLIKEALLIINGTLIEKIDGNFIHFANNIELNFKSKGVYDTLIGNIRADTKHHELFIPLSFFFNRIKDSGIPLYHLRKSSVSIKIITRPLIELYIRPVDGTPPSQAEIQQHVSDPAFYLNVDSYIYQYLIFLEASVRSRFQRESVKYNITIPKKHQYLGLSDTESLNIINNDVVDSIIIIPYRSDINLHNQWSNYTIYDYDLRKPINYLMHPNIKLAHEQIQYDYAFAAQHMTKVQYMLELLRTTPKTIIITEINTPYLEATFNAGDTIDTAVMDVYFKRLAVSNLNHDWSYYIVNDGANDPVYYTYTNTDDTYIPTLTIDSNTTAITIELNLDAKLESSSSNILSKWTCFPPGWSLIELAKYWKYRAVKDIPSIHTLCEPNSYFRTPRIIESFHLILNGIEIDEFRNTIYAAHGKLYESYKNNFIQNCIIYNFSENPMDYQASGHLNVGVIENKELLLKFKHIVDPLSYTFNTDVYIMALKEITFHEDIVHLY